MSGTARDRSGIVCSLTTVVLHAPWGSDEELVLSGEGDDTSVIGPIASSGEYARNLMLHLHRIVQPGWVVLDVGANVGPISLAVAQLVGPTGTVHSFEPAPVSYEHLVANVRRNGLGNVWPHWLALGDEAGTAWLAYEASFSGGAHLVGHGAPHSVAVPQRTLDDWAEEASLDRIDLIKCDVEGSEQAVLEGGATTIARLRPRVLIEMNPVTQRRSSAEGHARLWAHLTRVFPLLQIVMENGATVEVRDVVELDRHLRHRGIVDVDCSFGNRDRRRLPRIRRQRAISSHSDTGDVAGPIEGFVTGPGVVLEWAGPAVVTAAEPFHVTVNIDNGTCSWLSTAFASHPVSIGVRWRDQSGRTVLEPTMRTALPRDLPPGATCSGLIELTAPATTGEHVLEIGVVQEHYAWLSAFALAASCHGVVRVRM